MAKFNKIFRSLQNGLRPRRVGGDPGALQGPDGDGGGNGGGWDSQGDSGYYGRAAAPAAAAPAPTAAPAVAPAAAAAAAPAVAPAATNPFKTQVDDLTKATQVKPVTTEFNEKTGTAGRVDSIIAADSPLMQRAATRATQAMNARGLTNSSMAIGAGQAAVMDAAAPIAQQDASLYQQAQIANQNSTNQGNQFNASTTADIGTQGMKLGESSRQFDTGEASKKDMFAKEMTQRDSQFGVEAGLKRQQLTQQDTQFAQKLEQDVKMAGIDRDAKKSLIEAEAKYKTEIAGNENVANAWATTMRDISTIQNNPDLDEATKKTLIENAAGGFRSFTNFWGKASGGRVDVSDLLNFNTGAAPAPGNTSAAPAPAGGGGGGGGATDGGLREDGSAIMPGNFTSGAAPAPAPAPAPRPAPGPAGGAGGGSPTSGNDAQDYMDYLRENGGGA